MIFASYPLNGCSRFCSGLASKLHPHFNRNQQGGSNWRNSNHLESPNFTKLQQDSESGSGLLELPT
jgi:hypothetical protein